MKKEQLSRKRSSFDETALSLRELYRTRSMGRKIYQHAQNLLKKSFAKYGEKGFDKSTGALLEEELALLSRVTEVLDYFNAFDDTLKQDHYHLSDWVLKLSEQMNRIIKQNDTKILVQEPSLWLERIRFAAIYHNELYRNNDIEGCCVGLGYLIKRAEECEKLLRQTESTRDSLVLTYSCLGYLYFWSGKAHRTVDFSIADEAFSKTYDYFLRSAGNNLSFMLSESSKTLQAGIRLSRKQSQPEHVDPNTVRSHRPDRSEKNLAREYAADARASFLRLGVVDLARAWMRLIYGQVSEAEIIVKRAQELLAPGDILSRAYADLILGTCLRLQAHRNSPQMNEAIKTLTRAFDIFLGHGAVPSPRHAIRTVRELVFAFLINGKMKDADHCLQQVEALIEREPRFEKLKNSGKWQMQKLLLQSRIERKRVQSGDGDIHRMNRAISLARDGVKLSEAHGQPMEQCDALITLGEALFFSDKLSEARQEFERALQINDSQKKLDNIPGNPGITGICNVYLARSEMKELREGSLELINKYYEKYKSLTPKILNMWIDELADEIFEDRRLVESKQIVIPICLEENDEKSKYDYYLFELQRQLIEKISRIKGNRKSALALLGKNPSSASRWQINWVTGRRGSYATKKKGVEKARSGKSKRTGRRLD